jgi:hypothetical protein
MDVPAIIDVEASGFGQGSYPIEVGFILPDLTSFCCLIKPEPDWTHWDPDAENIHGIKRETLFEKGKPAAEVAEILNQYLRNKTVYTDGWGNDHSWLSRLYDQAGKTQKFRLQTLASLLSEKQMAIWKANKLKVTEELSLTRHRASADARILQMTYIRTWTGSQEE